VGTERGQRGITYIEMVATAAIVMILASAILPLIKVTKKRQKEIELRHNLRVIRTALDRYHYDATHGPKICGTDIKLGSEGFPPDLEVLVKGVNDCSAVGKKLKYLRRIPIDPMTGGIEWGTRCLQDDPDSTSWCGDNVWDVYTKSEVKGLDGTPYKDW
jgi:general secretion pathway protein G